MEKFLVGGDVRDMLLGRESKDRDKSSTFIQAAWDNPPPPFKSKKDIKEEKRRNRSKN